MRYIENKLKPVSEDEKISIVRAAIKNYRVNNIHYLIQENYPVINLINLYYVISDSQYYYAGNELINLFCQHLDEIKGLNDPYLIPHVEKIAKDSTKHHFSDYILPVITLIRKQQLTNKLNQTPTQTLSQPKL